MRPAGSERPGSERRLGSAGRIDGSHRRVNPTRPRASSMNNILLSLVPPGPILCVQVSFEYGFMWAPCLSTRNLLLNSVCCIWLLLFFFLYSLFLIFLKFFYLMLFDWVLEMLGRLWAGDTEMTRLRLSVETFYFHRRKKRQFSMGNSRRHEYSASNEFNEIFWVTIWSVDMDLWIYAGSWQRQACHWKTLEWITTKLSMNV